MISRYTVTQIAIKLYMYLIFSSGFSLMLACMPLTPCQDLQFHENAMQKIPSLKSINALMSFVFLYHSLVTLRLDLEKINIQHLLVEGLLGLEHLWLPLIPGRLLLQLRWQV